MCLLDLLSSRAMARARGDIELKTECRQVVPERIVQVARDTQAFGGAAALCEQRARRVKVGVGASKFHAGEPFALLGPRLSEREDLKSRIGAAAGHTRNPSE